MFYYSIWIGFVSSFSAFVETTIPSQGGVHRHVGVVMAGVEAEMVVLERKENLRGSWAAFGRRQEIVMNWAAVGPGVVVWILEQG